MHTLNWISMFMVFIAVIFLTVGGLYNSNSINNTYSPGQISAYSFTMSKGEIETLEIKSTDYFTFYIMDSETYKNATHGNFTGSIYANTTRDAVIRFAAPKNGVYYIVIANVNTKGYIEVSIIYGQSREQIFIAMGALLGVLSVGVAVYQYIKERRSKDIMDANCPYCGSPVKTSWNFCANCRYKLKEE